MFIDIFSNGFGKIGSIEMGLKFEGSHLSQDFCFLKYVGEGVLVINTKDIYICIMLEF